MDQSTVAKVKVEITDEEEARLKRVEARPPLSEILNLHDFEVGSAIRSANRRMVHHIRGEIGHCPTGNAGESLGLLLFRCRR